MQACIDEQNYSSMNLSTEFLDVVSTLVKVSFSNCLRGMLRWRLDFGSHAENEAPSIRRNIKTFIVVVFIILDYDFTILGVCDFIFLWK